MRCNSHIEYTDSTECAGVPLLLVALHGWLHGVGEFTNEGNGPFVARQMLLFLPIHRLLENEQSKEDCTGSVQPGCRWAGREANQGTDGDEGGLSGRGGHGRWRGHIARHGG